MLWVSVWSSMQGFGWRLARDDSTAFANARKMLLYGYHWACSDVWRGLIVNTLEQFRAESSQCHITLERGWYYEANQEILAGYSVGIGHCRQRWRPSFWPTPPQTEPVQPSPGLASWRLLRRYSISSCKSVQSLLSGSLSGVAFSMRWEAKRAKEKDYAECSNRSGCNLGCRSCGKLDSGAYQPRSQCGVVFPIAMENRKPRVARFSVCLH